MVMLQATYHFYFVLNMKFLSYIHSCIAITSNYVEKLQNKVESVKQYGRRWQESVTK